MRKKRFGKKILIAGLVGLAMFLGANKGVIAQEGEGGPNLDNIIEGVNVSGFVTSAYQYNLAEDGSRDDGIGGNGGRDSLGFPNFLEFRDDNSINLEALEVQIVKEATAEHPVGFGFVTDYGEIARNLTFGGRFPNGDHDNNDEDRFALQAGFVEWLIPVGKGIDFKIGKFATWIGSEVIEDVDNPNLTHSQNYNNSIPFTHSGLSLGYDLTDNVRTTFYFVNGWDSFTDNNDAKTFGWQVAWSAKSEKLSMVFNGIHGAEKADSNDDMTHLFDWVSTFKLSDKLSFLANFDYGWTEEARIDTLDTDTDTNLGLSDTDGDGIPDVITIGDGIADSGNGIKDSGADAHWAGGALTAIYQLRDWMNAAVRYEYSDYTDEFGFSVWEVTAGLNMKVSNNLLIRPEYRHNQYNDDGVGGSGQHGDDIVAVGFSYIF